VVTTPLVLNSAGQKMGKTEKGALWMSAPLTSAFDYFQYWLNIDDKDVGSCLRYFTFLPMEEVRTLEALPGASIREAKQRLAWEATALAHGEAEARRARDAAQALFGAGTGEGAEAPTVEVTAERFQRDLTWAHLFVEAGLCKSTGEARRLAEQGGMYVGGRAVTDATGRTAGETLDGQGGLLLRAGKKKYCRVVLRG
jgi:tyrosyl-tRNA synthetase